MTVRRLGSAIFAGTNEPRVNGFGGAAPLPLLIQFDDGTEITAWVDGREAEQTFEYRGSTRASLASVDPDAMLLLDDDRTNNTRTHRASVERAWRSTGDELDGLAAGRDARVYGNAVTGRDRW